MRYKLFNGNCVEVLKQFGSERIDLTITSPPYDDLRVYNGFQFNYQEVIIELYRVTKDGGVVIWVVADRTTNGSESGTSFKQALFAKEIGFNLHDTMIYVKENPVPLTHNRYEQSFEYMFVFSKGAPKTFNPILDDCISFGKSINRIVHKKAIGEIGYATRCRDEITTTKEKKIRINAWSYVVGKGSSSHPAPFPIELVQDHMLSWSNPDDVVLDPMMGSGTTGICAARLRRKFVGIEISEDYFTQTKEQIESAFSLKVVAA